MNITVILCTFNRCQSLPQALVSVAASDLPSSVAWEVLVVDNNSKDRTREVVEDFSRRYPGRFRYLFEPKQGLSQARNTGIREARGEILAFMDDDVTVEPTWLQNLTANLHDGKWAGAGGRILPERSFSPPRWLALEGPNSLGGTLAFLDLGPEAGELTEPPYGTNMAFLKVIFEEFGGFRTDLGRSGNGLLGGEDTEIGQRLLGAGKRLRYEPSAVVYHPVVEDRLKKEYFLAWRFNYGRCLIRLKGKGAPVWGIPRHYISIPRRILHLLPTRALQWMVAFDPKQRFMRKCLLWAMAGETVEIFCQLGNPKNGSAVGEANRDCKARS
jgi:glycosyltransferase involved in cell wall biosynthesis